LWKIWVEVAGSVVCGRIEGEDDEVDIDSTPLVDDDDAE
jgi:hypothetical protein